MKAYWKQSFKWHRHTSPSHNEQVNPPPLALTMATPSHIAIRSPQDPTGATPLFRRPSARIPTAVVVIPSVEKVMGGFAHSRRQSRLCRCHDCRQTSSFPAASDRFPSAHRFQNPHRDAPPPLIVGRSKSPPPPLPPLLGSVPVISSHHHIGTNRWAVPHLTLEARCPHSLRGTSPVRSQDRRVTILRPDLNDRIVKLSHDCRTW